MYLTMPILKLNGHNMSVDGLPILSNNPHIYEWKLLCPLSFRVLDIMKACFTRILYSRESKWIQYFYINVYLNWKTTHIRTIIDVNEWVANNQTVVARKDTSECFFREEPGTNSIESSESFTRFSRIFPRTSNRNRLFVTISGLVPRSPANYFLKFGGTNEN